LQRHHPLDGGVSVCRSNPSTIEGRRRKVDVLDVRANFLG
jgi:hypothetical protein